MTTPSFPRLLGDVGGTNVRLAWQALPGAPLTDIARDLCANHASLQAAIAHYLQVHHKPTPRACAIGIANPIVGDHVRMTNHHWSFSIAGLQADLQVDHLVVINDFTAIALALPALPGTALRRIGGGDGDPAAARAILGPGTGLGVAGLVPAAASGAAVVSGEGGHVTLAASTDDEAAVIRQLRERFGHASAERALSGPGLVNLHAAVCALEQRHNTPLQPADVIARGRDGSDPACRKALDHFCALLGSVAGNLALTLGARGGVYIGGGIVPRLGDALERSAFRARFDGKGRFRDYLQAIPVYVIDAAESPALIGASHALDLEVAAGRTHVP